MGKTTESPLSNVTPKPTGTTTIFDELCHLPKAQQQWENRTYIIFDDGDIRDSLDILTLENEHLCGQSEPEFTKTPRLLILWALALIVTIAPCRLK